MESVDLLSFEYDVAIPSPYFNLEDELAETKKKLQRLETKYKKNKDRTKQRWKKMEERLNQLDETVLKLKEEKDQYLKHLQKKYTSLDKVICVKEEHDRRLEQLEEDYKTIDEKVNDMNDMIKDEISMVQCIDPNGQLQLYDLCCSEIKITTKSNQVFLSMDGKLFCNILFFNDENNLLLLKQNRYMKYFKIELTGPIEPYSDTPSCLCLNTLVKVCDALLYNTAAVNKGALHVWFKCVHMDRSLSVVQEMIKLFKKSSTVYTTSKGEETTPYDTYSKLTLHLNQCYKREIDEMKAHCTENNITLISE